MHGDFLKRAHDRIVSDDPRDPRWTGNKRQHVPPREQYSQNAVDSEVLPPSTAQFIPQWTQQ